jgi:MFS family permease
MNAGMVVGFVLVGHFIDRWHVANVILLATICTVFGVVVLWGISVSLPPLCLFAVLYGIFAGSASATWPGIVRMVKEKDQSAPVGLLLGLFTAVRGVGSIVCGPVSEALINSQWPWAGKSFATAYGTNFGGLILFTGVTASFGVVGFGARKIGLLH